MSPTHAKHTPLGELMAAVGIGIETKNAEGYPDSTTFQALRRVQRAEFGYRPLTYICSPYRGDVEANTELARRLCKLAVARKKIPLAPHLLFPQFMYDSDEYQRELEMFMNRILLGKCESQWVWEEHITAGMRLEIEWASLYKKPLPVTYINHSDLIEVRP